MEKQNDYKAEQDLLMEVEILQLPMQKRLNLLKLIEDALCEAYKNGKEQGKADERERIRIGYPIVD